jgi:hypothetical protein
VILPAYGSHGITTLFSLFPPVNVWVAALYRARLRV